MMHEVTHVGQLAKEPLGEVASISLGESCNILEQHDVGASVGNEFERATCQVAAAKPVCPPLLSSQK